MIRILSTGLICAALILGSVGIAAARSYAPPPDAGISDEELEKLGPDAVPALIARLQDAKNEQYFRGLAHRLSVLSLERGPDARIPKAFEAFIAKNSPRSVVPFQTIMAMYEAIRAMGYVGGDTGVDYLIAWVEKDHKNIKCRDAKGTVESTASELRDAAILGLGFSGNPKARKFLEDLSERKPDVPYKGGFMGAVKDALKYNKEAATQGVKETMLPRLKGPDQKPQKKERK